MPNIYFEVREYDQDSGEPFSAARLRAIRPEFKTLFAAVEREALKEGHRVAVQEAPRSPIARNEGHRIRDSIFVTETRYAPGGLGGGGFYQAELFASAEVAPHLPFVFEGTADKGTGRIYPSRGNVLVLHKEGEGLHFRKWVHGQPPQQRWWEKAQEAMLEKIDEGIQTARFIHGI